MILMITIINPTSIYARIIFINPTSSFRRNYFHQSNSHFNALNYFQQSNFYLRSQIKEIIKNKSAAELLFYPNPNPCRQAGIINDHKVMGPDFSVNIPFNLILIIIFV